MSRHCFFFFNDTATTESYTLSLHDALPICRCRVVSPFPPTVDRHAVQCPQRGRIAVGSFRADRSERSRADRGCSDVRSEEHTSELQSRQYLVCRLLLEKKKNKHSEILLFLA